MPNNYPNPLDEFRSHSVQYILTVANTTEAHRKMLDAAATGGGSSFLQAVNNSELGGRINFGGESAYLLVDTRRYSQFSITSFEMQHVYGTGSPENPTVPKAASKMRLVDTTGLSFFNFLMDVMRNKVQSTRASAFFMLTIIFTGHNDASPPQTTTVSTCFIPMILLNLEFEFTSSGSTFELDFMETEGNPGAGLPQALDLGDIQSVSTESTSNTIGGMIQSLEDRLNLRSLQFYQKYSNEAMKQASSTQQKNFAGAGKLVQYMITVPDDWKNFKINTAGKSQNVEQVFLAKDSTETKAQKEAREAAAFKEFNDGAKEGKSQAQSAEEFRAKMKASYHSFSAATAIPDAIKIIFDSSKEFLELASTQKRKEGTALVHKTLISVTSDANTYMIHYDIYPLRIPKIDESDKVKTGEASKGQQKLANGQMKNLITYDYLFSGKNSHVLDMRIHFSPSSAIALDIDVDMGQSRLAGNASTGQSPKDVKEIGNSKTKDFSPLIRPGEPIFIPMKTRDQQTNFSSLATEEFNKEEASQHIKAKQEHTSTMAALHFLGSMHAEMTVRGNPNIIRKYADRNVRGGIPKHPATISSPDTLKSLLNKDQKFAEDVFNKQIKGRISSEKAQYYNSYVKPRINDSLGTKGTDPLLHGSDVAVNPLFVKVNIFAPNVDFLGSGNQGDMFTNKFFYTGAYMVMFINTIFDQSSFKHTLNLIPYDVDGSFSNAAISSPPPLQPSSVTPDSP